jgi:hypothetical protein
MMVISDFVTPEVLLLIQNDWTVPAGVIALYFYGRFHFNTPSYPIVFSVDTDERARLITQAPPIFTTRRSRYNSYSIRYILILEFAFLSFIFLFPIIRDAASIGKLNLPDLTNEPLQYRVIFALFFLTSLLSSFPIVKNLDVFLLNYLHRSAFIPDDVRMFASKLCGADFTPAESVVTTVRATLTLRDTSRVASGSTKGTLEQKLISLLCLRTQLDATTASDAYQGFKIALAQDFNSIGKQAAELRNQASAYLRDQERLVPSDSPDIDLYLASNADKTGVSDLSTRRLALIEKCDTLYEILCLIVAVALFATKNSREDIDSAVSAIGFKTTIDELPILDWDTVGIVTSATFVLVLLFNGIYAMFFYLFDLFRQFPSLSPDRVTIIRYSLLIAIGYAIVIWLAMTVKRAWRIRGPLGQNPENLLIGIFCYLATFWINVIIGYSLRHEFTHAPFLFALNQAVLGYFIGEYLDRALSKHPLSIKFAFLQAAAQSCVALIATSYSPTLIEATVSVPILEINIFIGTFSMVQAAVSGFIVSIVFQYYYALPSSVDPKQRIRESAAVSV